jgi:hypothetical protein
VTNIFYENICIKNAENALLFTPYYSTKALPSSTPVPLIPDFHDIYLKNVRIIGTSDVKLQGFQAATAPDPAFGGAPNPQYPLTMSMTDVVADTPDSINVIASDANLTLDGVNLPLLPSDPARIVINGAATRAVDPSQVVDCSKAFIDFPTLTNPNGAGW